MFGFWSRFSLVTGTRWFRFSCCAKVFPCDKCHDEAENHHTEHANRMICGLCSREQNYRPEDCRFCGNRFIAKNLSHYWEGGKGTRDQRFVTNTYGTFIDIRLTRAGSWLATTRASTSA